MAREAKLSYCGEQARRFDRDRFLCAMFAPEDRREALFALSAFNFEIAKSREVVSEPMLGRIRLQWWREAVGRLYETPGREGEREHEVLGPLGAAIRTHKLDRALFDALLDAREQDMADEPPETIDALIGYAEGTGGALNQLMVQVLDGPESAAMEAARHVGIAWALTGLVRAVPFHAGQRRLYLPSAVLAAHDVTAEAVFSRRGDKSALAPVVATITGVARERLERARAERRRVPRRAVPALLPATIAERYLIAIEKHGHDPFALPAEIGGVSCPLALMRRGWLGRY